jgi:hypothetical protein
MKTERMMGRELQAASGTLSEDGAGPLSAYPPSPRRRRRDQRVETNGLEAPAATREPVGASDLAAVRRLRSIVERLLEQTPGDALCDACLAFAAEAALIDMRQATDELPRTRPGVERGTARCESCRRETIVTVFRTAAAV